MIIGLYTLSASRRVYYSFICKEGRERERERDVIFCSSLLMKSEFSFYMLLCYIKINQHYSLQNILLFQIYVCVYKYIYIYITNMMYTYSEIFCIKGKRAEPCQWLLCSLFLLFFIYNVFCFFVFVYRICCYFHVMLIFFSLSGDKQWCYS